MDTACLDYRLTEEERARYEGWLPKICDKRADWPHEAAHNLFMIAQACAGCVKTRIAGSLNFT